MCGRESACDPFSFLVLFSLLPLYVWVCVRLHVPLQSFVSLLSNFHCVCVCVYKCVFSHSQHRYHISRVCNHLVLLSVPFTTLLPFDAEDQATPHPRVSYRREELATKTAASQMASLLSSSLLSSLSPSFMFTLSLILLCQSARLQALQGFTAHMPFKGPGFMAAFTTVTLTHHTFTHSLFSLSLCDILAFSFSSFYTSYSFHLPSPHNPLRCFRAYLAKGIPVIVHMILAPF